MDLADPRGKFEGDLCLPDASRAYNGNSLAVICLHAGRYNCKKLFQNSLSTDKSYVPFGRRGKVASIGGSKNVDVAGFPLSESFC